jgi:uncharacterized protein YggE
VGKREKYTLKLVLGNYLAICFVYKASLFHSLQGVTSMRTKIYLLSVVLILAMLLGACAPVAQKPTAETPARTISVNGSSQVVLTPDIAYISIGVHSDAKDAKEGMAENNTQSQSVIDALVGAGVDKKDIRTTNFSIYPQQQYGPNGESLGTTFAVDNTVYVTMRDITKIGDLLDATVSAGANNVYGISFDIENKDAALAEARQKAMEDAHTQAEQMAQAAGVELGPVYSISSYNNYPTPVYDVKGVGGAAYSAVEAPISPGQMTITVDVSVVYEIK